MLQVQLSSIMIVIIIAVKTRQYRNITVINQVMEEGDGINCVS
jgi:hypothetical protein